MPQIKSAKKRVQVAERNRQRNVAYKSALKTALKKAFQAFTQKIEAARASEHVGNAYSLIDRAVLKGILHKNTGARYKARLMKAANTATQ